MLVSRGVTSFAQSAGGASAGSGSAAGSPSAGSAGAGTSGFSGIPSGPASPGGLNNAAEDPSGAANASRNQAPGTNNAGTAQSSGGGANTGAGVTTGSAGSLGTGTAAIAKHEQRCCYHRRKQDDRSEGEEHLPRLLIGLCASGRAEVSKIAQPSRRTRPKLVAGSMRIRRRERRAFERKMTEDLSCYAK